MSSIRALRALPLVLALLPTTALAGGWADYTRAFPAFPCADGWISCQVAGEKVDPDLRFDKEGRALPANSRLGWFDLDATVSFSPFSPLSDYPVTAPVAKPAPPPVQEASQTTSTPSSDGVADASDAHPTELVQTSDGEGDSDEPELVTQGHPLPPAPVPHVEPDGPAAGTAGPSAGGAEAQPAPSPTKGEVVETDKVEPEAGGASGDEGAAGEDGTGEGDGVGSLDRDVVPEVRCDDWVHLEAPAMLGRLSQDQVACLEASFAVLDKQTDKDKVSRLLMANAYSSNPAEWERLARRHLDEISQADPDICYALASRLLKSGKKYEEVIHWSEVALENRTVWAGDTYTSKVYALYRFRATAAQELSKGASETFSAAPSDAHREAEEQARGRAKTFAREWYDYAKAAGKDTTQAEQICRSAAGTSDFCTAD